MVSSVQLCQSASPSSRPNAFAKMCIQNEVDAMPYTAYMLVTETRTLISTYKLLYQLTNLSIC